MNIDQRVVENISVKDKINNSTYKIHGSTNDEVSFCGQVQSNILPSTIDNTIKKGVSDQRSNLVSKWQVMLCRLRLY